MTSATDVVNVALGYLGEPPILSMDEGSLAARTASIHYAKTVKQVLRAHPWACATSRATLARLSATPAFGFNYYYALPADFLRVVQINDNRVLYTIEVYNTQKALLTNESEVNLRYVANITNPDLWDDLLLDTIAMRLAAKMAPVFSVDPNKLAQLSQEFATVQAEARSIDAQDKPSEPFDADSWLRSRWGDEDIHYRRISEV